MEDSKPLEPEDGGDAQAPEIESLGEDIASVALTESQSSQGAISQKHVPQSLRKNFSWVLAGNMIYSMCNWGMTISLAKMAPALLAARELGYYQIGVTITQPIIVTAQLNLRNLLLTDHSDKYRFGQYLGLRIFMAAMAMLVTMGVAFVGHFDPTARLIIVVTGFGVCWDTMSDILYGFVQHYRRMERMGLSLLIKGVLSIGLFILLYKVTHSVIWAVFGSALGSMLTVCCWDVPTVLNLQHALKRVGTVGPMMALRPTFEPKTMWDLTCISFTLGITLVVITFNTYVTRYFVLGDLGVASMGIYSTIAGLVNIVGTMLQSLITAAVPQMSEKYRNKDRHGFVNIFNKCMMVSAVLGVGAFLVSVLFGHAVLSILFKAALAPYSGLFVWMMLVGLTYYISWPMTNGLTVFRAFKIQLWMAIVSVLVSAAASFVLVPRFGLLGAVWAFLISTSVRLAMSAWAYFTELNKRLPA